VSKEDKQNNGIPKNVKGDVWLVKEKNTAKSYLMKIIEKQSKHKVKEFGAYKEQILVQRRIDHPNFVSIIDYFEDLSNIYIVTENIVFGNLSSVIVSKRQLNEREACLCFVQLCSILNFMHSNGLVHRDIRAETILVTKNFTVKMANLSCCTELAENTGKL
jgi:serine/threonine protein kinase